MKHFGWVDQHFVHLDLELALRHSFHLGLRLQECWLKITHHDLHYLDWLLIIFFLHVVSRQQPSTFGHSNFLLGLLIPCLRLDWAHTHFLEIHVVNMA
jgi:hypothetical protein